MRKDKAIHCFHELFCVCAAKLSCDVLMEPDGGSVVHTGRTIGSEATYNCRQGFSLQGNMTRICQPDGMWSGNEPTCEGIW